MEGPSIEEAELEGPEKGRVKGLHLAPRLFSGESPERVLRRLLRLRASVQGLTVKYRQIPSSATS